LVDKSDADALQRPAELRRGILAGARVAFTFHDDGNGTLLIDALTNVGEWAPATIGRRPALADWDKCRGDRRQHRQIIQPISLHVLAAGAFV